MARNRIAGNADSLQVVPVQGVEVGSRRIGEEEMFVDMATGARYLRGPDGKPESIVMARTSPGGGVVLIGPDGLPIEVGGDAGPKVYAGVAITVAAYDAPAAVKAASHYVCTGANDQVPIEEALAALPAGGGVVLLSAGTFSAHVRMRIPNTQLMGVGYGTIVKTPPAAELTNNNTPIRVLADDCYVGNLTVDGNKAEQTVSTALIENVRDFDGVASYANRVLVEKVRGQNCHGHTFISWNDPFLAEGVLAGPRSGNVFQGCLVINRGERNSMDFASTDPHLGALLEDNINTGNVMRYNTLLNGANIVIHTGWDTDVIGNRLVGGGSIGVHTNSRRVKITGNLIQNPTEVGIWVNGGSSPNQADPLRYGQDNEIVGNTIISAGIRGIAWERQKGGVIRNNTIVSSYQGMSLTSSDDCTVSDNRIRGTLTSCGIRIQGTSTSERSKGLVVERNEIHGGAAEHALEIRNTSGIYVGKNKITGGTRGVEFVINNDNALVTKNKIKNGSGHSISAGNAGDTGLRVFENDIETPGGFACVYLGSADNVVDKNLLKGGIYGVRLGGLRASITNNTFSSQTGDVIYQPSADSTIRGNTGYKTEANGTATVASGTTSIVVTHGMAVTPSADGISLIRTNSGGASSKCWVSGITSTQFTLNVDIDPGVTTATFAWRYTLS